MKSENFVIITFDTEDKAIGASHALQDLAMRGDISMGYNLILRKGPDGKVEALKKETTAGRDTWSGMFIGMLAGLFLGPFGFLISMLAGTAIGAGLDSSKVSFENNFAEGVQQQLNAGKIAIVANVDESSPVFLDNAMKDFGGQVTRTVATSGKKKEEQATPQAPQKQ